jgi:hypothetical protein
VRLPFRHTGNLRFERGWCCFDFHRLNLGCFFGCSISPKLDASQSSLKTAGQIKIHAAIFSKVPDGRKLPVRGVHVDAGRMPTLPVCVLCGEIKGMLMPASNPLWTFKTKSTKTMSHARRNET